MSLPHYSFSRLDLYNKCPQAYKYRYIDKVVATLTDPLIIGTAVHEAAEAYMRHLIKEKRQTDIEVLQAITKEKGETLPDELVDDFTGIMERFEDSFLLENPEIPTFIELELAFKRDWTVCPFDDPGVYFRMKLDFMQVSDKLAYITDWKSNMVIPPQSAIDASLQLDIYSLGVSLKHPEVEEMVGSLFFARYGATRTSKRSLKDVARVKARIDRIAKKIEATKVFTARVSSQCEYCEYKGLCTTYQAHVKDLNLEDITDVTQAAALAKKTYLVEIFLKTAKAKLKAWVEMNGCIDLNDERLDFWKTEKTTFTDLEGLVKNLVSLGYDRIDIWGALNVSKTSLAKLVKKDKDLVDEMVVKYGDIKTETRFDFKKIKDEDE